MFMLQPCPDRPDMTRLKRRLRAYDAAGIPSRALMGLLSFDKHDASSIGTPHPGSIILPSLLV
ncbi:hypothetical protein BOS5A_201075 [Bosea sp. EC-HK365B]|nr:hypothetical protein BOSE46_120788 [Bosea sp. 46]CAD5274930.1 hypothetical protein BOSE7B_40188 [Bosea sp. 7B]VVT59208.1 hypothetical protein BOS5A_201075 [Bosea sp. EC-HK365B]VXB73547.1 hypothetical protein BOSE29B_120099 [Bosea sp. 29B]VXC13267.1 hypothetical protein BOSE125_170093 [Bosea sp. 125]VXC74507.1 hypothetical protein BOSE127_40365 [Bosea sp. 127]